MRTVTCYPNHFALLITGLCCQAAMAGSARETAFVIETWDIPSVRWSITPPSDYSYCEASFFDDKKQRRGINLSEYEKGVRLEIIDPNIKIFDRMVDGQFELTVSTGHVTWVDSRAYFSTLYHRGDKSASRYFFTAVNSQQLQALGLAGQLKFKSNGVLIAERSTIGLQQAVAALLKCRQSMVDRSARLLAEYAGLNADIAGTMPVIAYYRPYPIRSQMTPELIKRGFADIQISLDEKGFPTGCKVLPDQGADDFDQEICRSGTRLIRYRPKNAGVTLFPEGTSVRHRVHWDSLVRPTSRDMAARDNILEIPEL